MPDDDHPRERLHAKAYERTETIHPKRKGTAAPPASWTEFRSPIASGISSLGTSRQKCGRTYMIA